jgi:lysine 2,3-aminomutase
MDSSDGQSALVAEPPSSKTQNFRERYFPDITDEDWDDWRWQLNNRYTTKEQLESVIDLSSKESMAMVKLHCLGRLAINITPYYLSLISPTDPNHPLRRTVIPTLDEFYTSVEEATDPLAEDKDTPVPKLVHRYKDRALLLVAGQCASYCRYCTRSRLVCVQNAKPATQPQLNAAIAYIRQNTNIRDVIVSGGDPLLFADGDSIRGGKLDSILYELRHIKHVEIIRIGTKVPVVLPQRITLKLCKTLKKYHPLFMSVHFTHPDELTPECVKACTMLADAGIPLGSQTVLLSGINDNIETMKSLMHKLLMARVRPYYLYQCDPVVGTAHFRTPISKGIEIIEGLRGHTSGYAIPTFVVDGPGGRGKIPLQPNYVIGQDENGTTLRNFCGEICHYPG